MAPSFAEANIVDLTYSSSSREASPPADEEDRPAPRRSTATKAPSGWFPDQGGLFRSPRTSNPQPAKWMPPAPASSAISIVDSDDADVSGPRAASTGSPSIGDTGRAVISPHPDGVAKSQARFATPPAFHSPRSQQVSKTQTPKTAEWSAATIESSLRAFSKKVPRDHARLLHHTLETVCRQRPRHRRHLSLIDDLAGLHANPVDGASTSNTMKLKLKVR